MYRILFNNDNNKDSEKPKSIPLEFDSGIKFITKFELIKNKKSLNLVLCLNDNYGNKKLVSSVSRTSWEKTRLNLTKAMEQKQISAQDIVRTTDVLDNNCDIIFDIINKGDDDEIESDDSDLYEDREMSKDWVITEIENAKEKNKEITFETWKDGLQKRYEIMKEATKRNFPNAWEGLEFTLAVLKILNVGECTLPFAGIMLARSGGNKTLSSSMLVPWPFVYYTRHFTAKAFVSHNTAVTREALQHIDMLPRIRFKMLLTPELAPIFSASEDELLENIGVITSVLDGKGYTSNSGAQGQRGYFGNYMFVWIGATVDIPYRVHKLLSSLGPKLYCLRLSYVDPSDAEVECGMNEKFEAKRREVQEAVISYLIWFETCPNLNEDPETRLPKIQWNSSMDDPVARKYLVKLAKLLGKLRCHVEIWSQRHPGAHEYSEYGYALPNPEDPGRAATSLYNLTRGHVLTHGRNYITMNDLYLAVKVALSTASQERVALFDVLRTLTT
jgi:hypothetical protein